jgi:hypothetical protein
MLRITRFTGTHPNQTIRLEGKLLRPWVDEVRKACASATDPAGRTCLDLSALSFVDAAGEESLRELSGQGIKDVACLGVDQRSRCGRNAPAARPGARFPHAVLGQIKLSPTRFGRTQRGKFVFRWEVLRSRGPEQTMFALQDSRRWAGEPCGCGCALRSTSWVPTPTRPRG